LVAIDELHVVSQWGGDWRTSYSKLGILRSVIDRTVPWFGTSATLDPKMLEEVKQSARFDDEIKIIRNSVDRPDISFCIRRIEYPVSTHHDLRFMISVVNSNSSALDSSVSIAEPARSLRRLFNIPKTIVYIDSIDTIEKVVIRTISWLVEDGCSLASASQAVQAYHSELAVTDKRAMAAEFGKPDTNWQSSSIHRIFVATDAMGMGINNRDIRRIVQWRMPLGMNSLLQRAGRAARGSGINGEFIWLVDGWCFEIEPTTNKKLNPHTLNPLSQLSQVSYTKLIDSDSDLSIQQTMELMSSQPTAKRRSRKVLKDAERRMKLPSGFWEVINGTQCIRTCIIRFFDDGYDLVREPPINGCCSRCSNLDIPQSPKPKQLIGSTKSARWFGPAVREKLLTWRKVKARSFLQDTICSSEAIILPDKALLSISKVSGGIDTVEALREAVGYSWAESLITKFGDEVVGVIREACRTATPSSSTRGSTRGCARGSLGGGAHSSIKGSTRYMAASGEDSPTIKDHSIACSVRGRGSRDPRAVRVRTSKLNNRRLPLGERSENASMPLITRHLTK
jgi:hypothetical protein